MKDIIQNLKKIVINVITIYSYKTVLGSRSRAFLQGAGAGKESIGGRNRYTNLILEGARVCKKNIGSR